MGDFVEISIENKGSHDCSLGERYPFKMSLAKPQMRGFLKSYAKLMFPCVFLGSASAAAAYYYTISVPRIQAYEHFFKTWNDEIAFERMRRTGIFQGAPLEEEE